MYDLLAGLFFRDNAKTGNERIHYDQMLLLQNDCHDQVKLYQCFFLVSLHNEQQLGDIKGSMLYGTINICYRMEGERNLGIIERERQ